MGKVGRLFGDFFAIICIILFEGYLLNVTLSFLGRIKTFLFDYGGVFRGSWATWKTNLIVFVNGWILFVHNKVNNKKNELFSINYSYSDNAQPRR